MITKPQRKVLFLAIILTLMLISGPFEILIPNAQAAEPTIQQRGLSILSNVVGLNLEKYDVTSKEAQDNSLSYLNVVPQKTVDYDLTAGESKLRLACTFTGENLYMLRVFADEGSSPPTPFASNVRVMAQEFLNKYCTFTHNSVYGKLGSTLNNVAFNKNGTKTSGNIALSVSAIDSYITFKWYYTSNGAIAPYTKFMSMGFKNGVLEAFVDNWQLYNIGSTSVNLSEEEATAIALETAKSYLQTLNLDDATLDLKNFDESNVQWANLIFDSSLNADKTRNSDTLTLYPVWHIGIALNKWVGYMYGIKVDIWADTKEVRDVEEIWSSMPQPEETSAAEAKTDSMTTLPFPIVVAILVGTAIILVSRRKNWHYYSIKRKYFKTGRTLLCLSIASLVLFAMLTPVATVNATTRGAAIWGSESTGAYGYGAPTTNYTWRKSQLEISYQRTTAGYIAQYFSQNGYTGNNGINHQGTLSSKANILGDLLALRSNNDVFAVVDFDHGVSGCPSYAPPNEQHYMFEDNTGTVVGTQANPSTDMSHGVFDMDIYQYTNPSKLVFAYIGACETANIERLGQALLPSQPPYYERARGMPFGWTHRYVKDKSAMPSFTITQHISDDGYADPDWGTQVYIGFPKGSASLSQPVPYAQYGSNPYYYWVCSFLGHALTLDRSINEALDDASYQFLGSSFGSSPLRTGFYPFWWNLPTPPEYSVATLGVYGNGNLRLRYYSPPADMPSTPSVSGPTTGNIGVSYAFNALAKDPYGHNVKYRFDWGDGSPYTETGWYSDGVTGSASHSWSSAGQKSVKVQARCPNSGWSSWSTPRIISIGPVKQLTVLARNQYGAAGYVPLFIDGQYVGTTEYTYTVTVGNHQIYVQSPLSGNGYHVFQYYYYDSTYNYNNPMTLSITADKTVTAYYYSYS